MLDEETFTQKALDVFYKLNLQISEENGLPFIVCVFCYNTVAQFHAYFVSVSENQEKLSLELEMIHEESYKDEIQEIVKDEYHEHEVETFGEVGNYIEVDGDETLDSGNVVKTRNKRYSIPSHMIKRYKEGAPMEPDLVDKLAKKYNKLYICHFCEYYTFSRPRLVNHLFDCSKNTSYNLAKKHEKASYRCPPNKELLVIPCPLCPPDALKMKNEQILQLHLKEHADYDRIDRHRQERGIPPLIPCPRCERRLRSESQLHSHLKKHENDELMTCELCGRTMVTSNLRSHLRNHFKKIICEFCSKVFKNHSGLQRHIAAKHSGPEFYVCDRCNTKIRRAHKYREHLAICRGPGTVWPCIHCGESFESNSHRHYHVKKFHIGYKCKMCQVEVKSVTQLKHHYKSEAHKIRSQEKRDELAQSKLLNENRVSNGLKRR